MECDERLIEEALKAIRKAILEYLRVNCRRILSMAGITGQRLVKVELRGLFRYYESTPNFPKFIQAYKYLDRCKGPEFIRDRIGFIAEGEYAIFEIHELEDLCKAVEAGAGI